MPFDKEEPAGNLRAFRAKRRMSQQSVADAIGVDQITISNYENAVSGMSFENAWALADLFGVTLDDLGGRKISEQ